MSDQQYGIAAVGTAGYMVAGYLPTELIVEIGQYWLPAVAGIMRAGLSAAGDEDGGSFRYLVEDLEIEQAGAGDMSQASWSMVLDTTDHAPLDGNPVIIAVGTAQNRVFGGYLRIPGRTYLTPDTRQFQCEAVSWELDLDRRILNASYTNQYAGSLLLTLINSYAPYFKTDLYVETGVYIAEFVAQDESLLAVCARLAALSNYVFYIDPLKNVHFHRRELVDAPFDIEDGERFGGLSTSEDSSQLKNRIVVYYSQLQSKSQSYTGDGSTEDFQLSFLPYEVSSLQVNGSDVTFRTHYASSESVEFSVDYKRGIINTRDHATLDNTDTLTISYTAKVPAKLTVNHTASQNERAEREGGEGIYEYVVRGEDRILSKDDAQAEAYALLDRDAYPRIGAKYVRVEDLFSLLQRQLIPGMRQNLSDFGIVEALEINRVRVNVLVEADDEDLQWIQSVELGEPQTQFETLLKDVLTPVTQTQNIEISIEEEETYE